MEIGEARQDGMLVLRPVGRIDNLTSATFQDRLLVAARAGAADVVVDFTAVEYISSAGLRALMAASSLKPKERRIVVASLNSVVGEIFAISRFSEVIPVFENVDAAIAAGATAARSPAEAAPIRVHFWGSRGSLPTPLGAAAVRGKVRDALLDGARARSRDARGDRRLYRSRIAVFGARHIWRQYRLCRDRRRRRRIRAVRPRHRFARVRPSPPRRARAPAQTLLQRVPVASALGPRHGLPVFPAGLHSGQRHPHPWLP